MATKPGDGERRALGGYIPQYMLGAQLIVNALKGGDLEWVRVADPGAGRVDDIQIATTGRLDAHQVKWTQYGDTVTFKELTEGTKQEQALLSQLADGWTKLKAIHPERRVVVHLSTNRIAAYTNAGMPDTTDEPQPYHLSAFIRQAWLPAQRDNVIKNDEWEPVWHALKDTSGLLDAQFLSFVQDCKLDLQLPDTEESEEIKAVHNLLMKTVASPERIIELSRNKLLAELGWLYRYQFRNLHEFPAPNYLYRPIQATTTGLSERLDTLDGGYIGVFGPPGSGKSTFLTQTLRGMPIRLIRYYAYVPDAQDPSVLRGESINFFHDVTLRISQIVKGDNKQPDPTDRISLINRFHAQLQILGQDYRDTQTKTVILIDGLDHISREQNPQRSLLADLPLPEAIPSGVYIIVGSQTTELPDLPAPIVYLFSQNERKITIGTLAPSDVYAIIQNALPDIPQEGQSRIFELSDGHPLALIYLLNTLKHVDSIEAYTCVLENSLPYDGDIKTQYFAHWRQIINDEALVRLLGSLTRIRGPIPMNWIAEWAERDLLRKLQRHFVQYFLIDSQERWTFFHNSFRIFLEAQTASPLPGQTYEQIDRQYHLELAERYKGSNRPLQWESLYHYFRAKDYSSVIDLAQYDWFREQAESLRAIDAIETDVRLAMKAAGELVDAVSLMRYTLVGASLQQRRMTLENSDLPHLLVDSGEPYMAVDYARDGARLRMGEEGALRLSIHLFDAGLKQDAFRIFELAEPLEYLSGRPIPESNSSQNIMSLLNAWVDSACRFHSLQEIVKIIRQVRIEPSWGEQNKSQEEVSLDLQNWLLYKGAMTCCFRGKQDDWDVFYDALDTERDHHTRYFTLLRSLEYYRKKGFENHSRQLLAIFKAMHVPPELGKGRQRLANCLSIAETLYFLRSDDDISVIQDWLNKTRPVPLADQESTYEDTHKPHDLQFRYARLSFLLDSTLDPQKLIREAENVTQFGTYEEDDTKLARRQLHLVMISLAKLWANGHLGRQMQPRPFLDNIKWLFDLVEVGWASQSATFRLEVASAKSEIAQLIVVCAAKHGREVVKTIRNEFEDRWTEHPDLWWVGTQREVIIELARHDTEPEWLRLNLQRIESHMLANLDVGSRIEECEAQAEAWLEIGQREAAFATLQQLVRSSRGIYHDEDYQLGRWARWLKEVNKEEPSMAQRRIHTFLRGVASLEGNASGVDDALNIILQMLFDRSPQQAIVLFQRLLERQSITYQKGITHLLIAALQAKDAPIDTIVIVTLELVIPLVRFSSPELIEKLIISTDKMMSQAKAIDVTQQIVHRIRVNAVQDQRPNWFKGVNNGLINIGVDPASVGIQSSDLQQHIDTGSNSNLDTHLYLQSGERLSIEAVIDGVYTIDDLQELLVQEDRQKSSYFEWRIVAKHLSERISKPEELWQLETLINDRLDSILRQAISAEILTKISVRFLKLGFTDDAKKAIERALTLTEPSGWATRWDGGAKYAVLQQMLLLFGEPIRERLIRLYAQELSEHFRNPEQVLIYGEDAAGILFSAIPYARIWPDIEAYLDEIFTAAMVQPQPKLESALAVTLDQPELDTQRNAIADLMILLLDFPAYPVSNRSIRACTQAVLNGDESTRKRLESALLSHDQLASQALRVLDAVTLQNPSAGKWCIEQISVLQSSPNFIIRTNANMVYSRLTGRSVHSQRIKRNVSFAYVIHLPELALYKTTAAISRQSNPILLGDPALTLSPMDIEARQLARLSSAAETNVLYRAAQIFSQSQMQRTWFADDSSFTTDHLARFLSEVDLRFNHNKLKILPLTNAIAHVAAELYDAGYVEEAEWGAVASLFRDYDPQFYLDKPVPRPTTIDKIGGLDYGDNSRYVQIPDDWINTTRNSSSLLNSRISDGRIILGEWTKLKRLEEKWPTEERISLMRITEPNNFLDGLSSESDGNPFAWMKGALTSDYWEFTDFLSSELVIAHNAYRFQTPGANWLGFNPRVGYAMGWQPSKKGWFQWLDKHGKVVVESIWWQDGPFDLFSSYDNTEVGCGWLVLINDEGYRQIVENMGNVVRGGFLKRSIGWYGSDGMGAEFELLHLPEY